MATLTGRTIAASYAELLKTTSASGITASLDTVQDGDATDSALQLSSGGVKSTGTLEVAGVTTATGGVVGDLTGDVTGDLTGNVTATSVLVDGVVGTTQSSGNNSTKVATTAYVDAEVATSDTLAEILANGNTTGSTNIIVSASQSITTDTVSETTSAAGVTIDSVLVKDNTVTATTFTGDLTGDVTGDLTGNADTVTTNANLTGGVTSVGNAATVITNANLTGGVTSVGNAATVITNANLTGEVTSVGNAATIADDVVDEANLKSDNAPTNDYVLTAKSSASGGLTWASPTVGDITGVTAGTNLSGGGTSGTVTLNLDNPVVANLTGNASGSSGSCTGNSATVTNGVYTTNNLSVLAATTSAQLAGVISDETGSGSLVFATSPTLVTPALGTPASGVATNLTGTAASLTAGTVTTNANLTGGVTSVGNAATVITNANLTGDVTSSGNATTIATDAVDIAMLSATGTASSSTFLRGDNAWSTPVGSGDVSKVGTPVSGQVGYWTGDGTLAGENALFWDASNDRLGIGTATPSAPLHIYGADAQSVYIGSSNAGGATLLLDGDGNGDGSGGDYTYIRHQTDGNLEIRNILGDTYFTNDVGAVGIGTAAPTSLLDVRGPTGTGAASAGVLTLATNELTIVDTDQLGRIEFRSPLATAGTDAIVSAAAIWAEANATFSASVNSADIVFATATSGAASERMRITSAGLVGIGLTVPSEKLDVNGAIQCLNELRSTSGNDLKLNAGSANRDISLQVNDVTMMTVQGSTGRIGIGVTVPTVELDVSGSISLQSDNNLTWGNAAYAAGVPTISGKTDSGFYFHPDGSTSGVTLRILADGRVTVKKASNSEFATTITTSGSAIAIDFDDADNFNVTLSASAALSNPTNITAGQSGCIVFDHDGSMTDISSWGSYWHFEGGTEPTLSTGDGDIDNLVYFAASATSIHAVLLKDMS